MLSLPPITLRLRGWTLIDRLAMPLLLLCVPILDCQTTRAAQMQGTKTRTVQEEDIREAVLQRMMQDWVRDLEKDEGQAKSAADKESAEHYNFKIFFIEINQNDPTDEFLKRFVNIPRTIKKSSESQISQSVWMPVVDKESGKRGIIFRIGS